MLYFKLSLFCFSTYSLYDDDYGNSKSSGYSKFVDSFSRKNNSYVFSFHRNGNFPNYNSKGSSGYSSYNNKGYGNDNSDSYYRKKRQYGLNIDQDTSFSVKHQERLLPQQFQINYNPSEVSSYASINQQQPRLLPMTSFQQQFRLPKESISQPLSQRMLLFK